MIKVHNNRLVKYTIRILRMASIQKNFLRFVDNEETFRFQAIIFLAASNNFLSTRFIEYIKHI